MPARNVPYEGRANLKLQTSENSDIRDIQTSEHPNIQTSELLEIQILGCLYEALEATGIINVLLIEEETP